MKENEKEKEVFVFKPGSNEMKDDYPELKQIDEFRDLDDKELKMAYYMENVGSPLKSLDKIERAQKSMDIVFGKRSLSIEKKDKYLNFNKLPQHIQDAHLRMRKVNPGLRFKAYLAVEHMFENIIAITQLTEDDMTIMEKDIDEKKKYMELSTKGCKELPGIISVLENGFSIKTKGKEEKVNDISIKDIMNNR